ncbi:MAG: DUF1571 domain-containing protein [Isosphaeraceae bacterium]
MAAGPIRAGVAPSLLRRVRWWLWPLVALPTGFGFVCWWLTEPLDDSPVAAPVSLSRETPRPAAAEAAPAEVVWPEGRVEGKEAKEILLRALRQAALRLDRVDSYTTVFHKQERLKGKLGPAQTLAMKVRHRPFAVYCKFLTPTEGKEVVYAEGRHENKVIAHGGGVARFLVPRLAVAPDHPLALADSRHAITEAGLANLTARLIHFREIDLNDDEAETVLERVTDARGRQRLRSTHLHPKFHKGRPFARVVVHYDRETFFPLEIQNYDWPEEGQGGDLKLAEHYAYESLELDAPLTTLDFDPANPKYSFHRY